MKRLALALVDGQRVLLHSAVAAAVETLVRRLEKLRIGVLALESDNCAGWAVADLAATQAGIVSLPLPGFFSAAQRAHALRDAGAGWLLSAQGDVAALMPQAQLQERIDIAQTTYGLWRLPLEPRPLPEGTAKIIYTSGTTGDPKGVCLGRNAMMSVAASLAEACALSSEDTHLSALPLSTLLENVGGLYAQGLAGGRAVLLPTRQIGLRGMASFDPAPLLQMLRHHGATTTILVPQMLAGLVRAIEHGARLPPRLRFVAVGGAVLSPALLERARRCGLPVYEGYGLSECASVVALNTPDVQRPGSVGRVLPHARVDIDEDGEVRVSGAVMLGYTGSTEVSTAAWRTGDIGRMDADGYLHIVGRRRNMIVTSYGRNIAPEWVESELLAEEGIAQVAVFGEGRPWLCALIDAPRIEAVGAAVARANDRLPSYARIGGWIHAPEPFHAANGQLTPNGRPRRKALYERYAEELNALYEREENHVEL